MWLSGLHISGSGIANAGVPSGTSEWADAGSTISLYAYTNPGYDLSGWSTTGSITYVPQTAPLATATVDGPGTITANFQAQPAGSSGAIAVGFQALATDGVGFPVILGNVSVDGTPLSTKWEYGSTPDWAAGSVHTLSALSPVYGGNLRWIFVGWSDGGLQTHSYVVPGKQSGYGGQIAAFYKTQYLLTFNQSGLDSSAKEIVLTVDSSDFNYSSLPVNGWVDTGSVVSYSYSTPISSTTSGKQFILKRVSNIDVILPYPLPGPLDSPVQNLWFASQNPIIGNYKIQYYLTMSTNFGTVAPNSGWIEAGSAQAISATALSTAADERLAWNGWNGSGIGSYTGSTNMSTIILNGPITETAMWTHQYYLTVNSSYASTIGAGWYNSGDTAHAGVNSGTISGATGIRYVFTGWSVDASGTSYNQSNGITMNSSKTAMAIWNVQYQVSFAASPSGSGTLSPAETTWCNAGNTITLSATANSGYQFSSWKTTGSIVIASQSSSSTTAKVNGPGTVTATFEASGPPLLTWAAIIFLTIALISAVSLAFLRHRMKKVKIGREKKQKQLLMKTS